MIVTTPTAAENVALKMLEMGEFVNGSPAMRWQFTEDEDGSVVAQYGPLIGVLSTEVFDSKKQFIDAIKCGRYWGAHFYQADLFPIMHGHLIGEECRCPHYV